MVGIYSITNKVNGKRYVGSTHNLEKRWYEHKCRLNNKNHINKYLQNAWNKYDKENFIFEVLEYVSDKNELIKIEQYYIDWMDSANRNFGYNLSKITNNSTIGIKHTEEYKKKVSLSRRCENAPTRKLNKEQILKIRSLYENERYSCRELAGMFGVTTTNIRDILIYKTWNFDNIKRKSGLDKSKIKNVRGEERPQHKLTEKQVLEIVERYKNENITQKSLAKEYNMSKGAIQHILNGRTWNHLKVSHKKQFVKLNYNLAEEIREIYKKEKLSHSKIAKQFGVSKTSISLILENKIWRNNY